MNLMNCNNCGNGECTCDIAGFEQDYDGIVMYTVTPMLEDFQTSEAFEVNRPTLMQLVDKYNYGTLGHCDAWFQIHNDAGVELDIQDFYAMLEEEGGIDICTVATPRSTTMSPVMLAPYGQHQEPASDPSISRAVDAYLEDTGIPF